MDALDAMDTVDAVNYIDAVNTVDSLEVTWAICIAPLCISLILGWMKPCLVGLFFDIAIG